MVSVEQGNLQLLIWHIDLIGLGRVGRKVDNAIQWINLSPFDRVIVFPNTYSLDSNLSDA